MIQAPSSQFTRPNARRNRPSRIQPARALGFKSECNFGHLEMFLVSQLLWTTHSTGSSTHSLTHRSYASLSSPTHRDSLTWHD